MTFLTVKVVTIRVDGLGGLDTLLIFEDSSLFDISTLAGVTRIVGSSSAGDYAYDTVYPISTERVIFNNSEVTLTTSPDNLILGEKYSETINGTDGDDIIDPWSGSDTINANSGNDIVVIHDTSDNFSLDKITATSFHLETIVTLRLRLSIDCAQ